MPITNNDLEKLEQVFVTKKYLKKELEKYATKKVQDKIILGIVDIKSDICKIREELSEKATKKEIAIVKDLLIQVHDVVMNHIPVMEKQLRESLDILKNHEVRITENTKQIYNIQNM